MRYKVEISILVPIYNVEKYLPRCIESVLTQDFQDWELVLVDDGSPDKCGEICDEYASKHPDKIKVVHTKNKGVASARLTCFQNASGKYLMFLDSDDYLLPDALSTFYNKINEGYDIVKCWPIRENEKKERWIEEHNNMSKTLIGNYNYIKGFLNGETTPYLHSAIYKASLFNEKMFQDTVDNGIRIGEDWIINYMIAPKINKFYFISKPLYVYFVNTESIMSQQISSWEYDKRISLTLKDYYKNIPNELLEFAQKNSFDILIKRFFIPELKFSWTKYYDIKKIYKDNKLYIENIINKKYIRFIENSVLFFIYTRIYSFLYWVIRLKFRKRRIIK